MKYVTVRMLGIGFAMSCFLVLPVVVCAIEAREKFDLAAEEAYGDFQEIPEWIQESYSQQLHTEIAQMIRTTLLEEGIVVAIFLFYSALSFRSLRSEDDGLLTWVAACDGCGGLLLAAVGVLSMSSEADALYEGFPAFAIVDTASHLIMAMFLVLLATLGFRLRGAMLEDRPAAKMVADSEGKAAAVAAVVAAEGVPEDSDDVDTAAVAQSAATQEVLV
jgi:hypothetical protein